MSQVIELATLQEIDNEAAALRGALASVERRLGGDEELEGTRAQLEAAESARAAIAAEQRALEGEVERLNAKILPEERRLYDGSVHNPKELTSIQHEIDLLKTTRGRQEDALVEVLDRAEAAERECEGARKNVARLEGRWEQDRGELEGEARRLSGVIAGVDQTREAQAAKVATRVLQTYEDLRRRKSGVAVARIQGGACAGCRISIPNAVRTRVLSGAVLAQCPNCERILYAG